MGYSKKMKSRVRVLLLASSLAVALVFGLSFYFSLVSTESALANTVPELEELAERFKSTLMLNTLAFVAILIISFVVLGSLVTDRMFGPVEKVEEGLMGVASGKLPGAGKDLGGGPFGPLCEAFNSACSYIEDRERSDIAVLEECVTGIEKGLDVTDTLRGLIEAKRGHRETGKAPVNGEAGAPADDDVFMQPV